MSEKATIRQTLTSETIEKYIQISKVTRNLNVLDDEDERQGMMITNYKSQAVNTGIDQPLQKNTRPYSLAKTSWFSDLTQDKISIAESINKDDDVNEYDDVNKILIPHAGIGKINDKYLNIKKTNILIYHRI